MREGRDRARAPLPFSLATLAVFLTVGRGNDAAGGPPPFPTQDASNRLVMATETMTPAAAPAPPPPVR